MAVGGEAVKGPAFPEVNPAIPEIGEELGDGGRAGVGRLVFARALFHQGIQHADQKEVQMTGHAGNGVGTIPSGDAAGQFAEALRNGGRGSPDGIFDVLAVLPAFGEGGQVLGSDDDPRGPGPGLIRPAHADIEDDPVDAAAADIGVAEFMELPGAGDEEIAGVETEGLVAHHHIAVAGLQEHDFDAFVAVRFEPPILGGFGIPEADAVESGQDVLGHEGAGIVALGERVKLDFALANGLFLRLAIVDLVKLMAGPINWWRGHGIVA